LGSGKLVALALALALTLVVLKAMEAVKES
jgi:hypothetical protein